MRGGVSFNKGTEAESSDLVTVLSVPSDKAVPAESSAPVKEREKSGEIENIIPQQSSSEVKLTFSISNELFLPFFFNFLKFLFLVFRVL